jgi:glycerol-3-phosphate dehydrogenase (NAD(P)+)
LSRIAIIGSGAWGTALAISLARRGGHTLHLGPHTAAVAEAINASGENSVYLRGYTVPATVFATDDLAAALAGAQMVIGVMPSAHARSMYTQMAPHLCAGQMLVSATKGVVSGEPADAEEGGGSYQRVSQVIETVLTRHKLTLPVAVLSGPSFAQEVAAGQPTAMTVACSDSAVAARLRQELSGPALRLYTNEDVTGVELGGALKNVIAIATGMVDGLGLGHNSAAALITRGIAEITRLAVACGGRRETLAGLSGLGDLVLTCTGDLSRNRSVGMALGQGDSLREIMSSMGGKVAEGVHTTHAALGLAARHGIEMPITAQVNAILHHGKSPSEAVAELMGRPGRREEA